MPTPKLPVGKRWPWDFPDTYATEPGPLGDGPSYAHDVQPLRDELALAEEHPEYEIDTEAVREALAEAEADARGQL